ncbi:PREDICTED: uncharacterized protein LOC105153608 isoform X2 [Acromyrmex echinatior]|uniref:uncharacterized protein LOC105153608 isoform X2 n=1 Tax=Acromyrmex echinatior TaxID=103372 RepID=UPI000580E762|nr:PREDICTED: uncharacterized protein LOC105153608 isoform X2 [Acromyrmex echinatior]XP_011066850.1 PREDICTED: uncharacterized protein LOC105153608 isoform X2 [Acromyrmex echinatior]
MSQTMTIRDRTQREPASANKFIINTGFLKTWGGFFKLLQAMLGIISVGIGCYQFRPMCETEFFFILVITAFMINTCILLISCLTSYTTATIITKTTYELLYHSFAFGSLFAVSLALSVHYPYAHRRDDKLLASCIIAVVNTACYLCSMIIAIRTYRGH